MLSITYKSMCRDCLMVLQSLQNTKEKHTFQNFSYPDAPQKTHITASSHQNQSVAKQQQKPARVATAPSQKKPDVQNEKVSVAPPSSQKQTESSSSNNQQSAFSSVLGTFSRSVPSSSPFMVSFWPGNFSKN